MDSRKAGYAVTIGVALFAATNSYSHIYALARTHGQSALDSALLPLSVDGLILAGSLALLHPGERRRKLSEAMVILGALATLAANVLSGLHSGTLGAVIAAWPAVAFLGTAEVAIGMVGRRPKPAVKAPEPATVRRPRPGQDALGVGQAQDHRAGAAPGALAELRASALNGVLPSKRFIKSRAGVGWDRAVQIHGELAALVPA